MKKIDKRVEKNTKSVTHLKEMLREVCQNPSTYLKNEAILNSLKSQSCLAKYINEDREIYGSSLNTVKRIADQCIDGGFQTLDKLRIAAYQALIDHSERIKSSNKRTRAGLAKKVIELEKDVVVLRKTNYNLLQAVMRAKNTIHSLSGISDERIRIVRSEEALRALVSLVSLNVPPFDIIQEDENSNVVQITSRK